MSTVKHISEGNDADMSDRGCSVRAGDIVFFRFFELVKIAGNRDIPMPKGPGERQQTNLKKRPPRHLFMKSNLFHGVPRSPFQ